MDFEYDYEEREKDGMVLEIDGLKINIPESLIQEKMELFKQSREYVENCYKEKAEIYKECFLHNNTYSDDTFEQEFLNCLDDELDIFRPNKVFKFDPMAGFWFDNNKMNITIDGLNFCFSKELIQERMSILRFDTLDEVAFDIENLVSGYLKCLSSEELESPLLSKQVEEWLLSELDIFRPDIKCNFKVDSNFSK